MATHAPIASEAERTFLVEELFFSTTDVKGIIRSGNDVFTRVAAYAEEELLGKPHNIIRHDDVPRAVFQLLWDEILAGRSIAAYVKNRAKDGAFYWVMAAVVPAGDGFLSVRLKPTSEIFGVVQGLYRELRDLERSIETGEGKARKRAIEASTALLVQRLGGLGFPDYTSFMRVALATELEARERALARGVGAPEEGGDALLRSVRDGVGETLAFLDGQFANLNGYVDLNQSLSRKSGFVGELAASVRLFSLNALIAATRLGAEGAALSAVAGLMGSRSVRVAEILRELSSAIERTVDLLTAVVFEISVCKLQAEMTVAFSRELLRGGDHDPVREARRRADVALLVRSVGNQVDALLSSLTTLGSRLREVAGGSERLAGELGILRALQMNGRIEAAALDDAGDVGDLFARIRESLDEATRETAEVLATVRGAALSRRTHDEARAHVEQLGRLGSSLAA